MNTIMPIIVPMHDSEPSQCPKCGKPEDIRQVCHHCGYKYREEEGSVWWGAWVLLGIIIIAALWLLFTVAYWLFEQAYSKPTLLAVLKAQVGFFRGLRIW